MGAGSSRPNPPIPLNYFNFPAKAGNSVYINDIGNSRVLRVNLGYAKQWDSQTGKVLVKE